MPLMSGEFLREFERKVKRVEYYAPYCQSIGELCRKSGVPRPTLYRWFKDDTPWEIKIRQGLGSENPKVIKDGPRKKKKLKMDKKSVAARKRKREQRKKAKEKEKAEEKAAKAAEPRKTNKGRKYNTPHKISETATREEIEGDIRSKTGRLKTSKAKEVIVTIQPKNKSNFNRTPAERRSLADQVCEIIESGVSVGQACEAVGVNQSTFYRWKTPSYPEYDPEIEQRFIRAKETFNSMMEEEMQFVSKIGISRLLKERKVTHTTKIGRINKDGVVKPHSIIQRENIMEPSFSAVKFALGKLDVKKFGDVGDKQLASRSKDEEGDNKYELRAMTLEQLQAEKEMLQKKLNPPKEDEPE